MSSRKKALELYHAFALEYIDAVVDIAERNGMFFAIASRDDKEVARLPIPYGQRLFSQAKSEKKKNEPNLVRVREVLFKWKAMHPELSYVDFTPQGTTFDDKDKPIPFHVIFALHDNPGTWPHLQVTLEVDMSDEQLLASVEETYSQWKDHDQSKIHQSVTDGYRIGD